MEIRKAVPGVQSISIYKEGVVGAKSLEAAVCI